MLPMDSSLYHEDSDLTEWKALLSGEATMHREPGIQEIYIQACFQVERKWLLDTRS